MLVTSSHSALLAAPGAAPEWVQLLPAGVFRGSDGRGPYRVADLDALIRASMAAGKLPLDENHATDLAMTTGQPSPARGWIVEMQAREGALWGRVEWTQSGLAIMTEGSYRGISPVFVHSKKDGSVTQVLRAALTNTPNLAQLPTIHSQGNPMDLIAQLRAALGLPETADEAACLTAVGRFRTESAAHATTLRTLATTARVAGADSLAPDALVTALQTHLAAPPASDEMARQVVALQTQLQTLQAEGRRAAAEAFIDGAIRAGKPIAPIRDHYVARHMADSTAVETEVNALPSINAGGVALNAGNPGGNGDELTEADRHACEKMGLDPKAYLANKKRMADEAARDGGTA